MARKIFVIVVALLVATPALVYVPCRMGDQPSSIAHTTLASDSLIVLISDTQDPIWVETLRLKERNNTAARASLFRSITGLGAAGVVHCGDLVAAGFCRDEWTEMDEFVGSLAALKVPFFPVLGNHEVLVLAAQGREEFELRYPHASTTGYLVRGGSTAFLLLNSNFSDLSEESVEKQRQWFISTLRSLDADSTVRFVVVTCHHSPFTNSTIVDPSVEVERQFVGPFLESAKARLFASGHAHAAEHFRREGKDFLVLGGGGGLQQPLLTGDQRRWPDHFPEKGEIRPFHYVTLRVDTAEARVAIHALEQDRVEVRYAFTIALPP